MAHDAGFLAKCEQFLLHPTVRSLSLAQRVDFLEQKGLSPEEITACLKNVERQNGLSRVLQSASNTASTTHALSSTSGTVLSTSVWKMVRNYGLAAVATLLMAYGYVRFKQKMVLQLLMAQRQAAVARRETRQATVVRMLELVSEQRKQYEQVVGRVKSRITKLQLLKDTGSVDPTSAMEKVQQKRREEELRTLQQQVTTLKTAVLVAYQTDLTKKVQQQARPEPVAPHPDLATEEELMDEKPVIPTRMLTA